jgi:hypothetical protein
MISLFNNSILFDSQSDCEEVTKKLNLDDAIVVLIASGLCAKDKGCFNQEEQMMLNASIEKLKRGKQ